MVKNNRQSAINKLQTFPIAVISLSVIYPGIGLLIKYTSSSYTPNAKIDCQAIPGELSGLILLSEIFLMYAWIPLIAKFNNAVLLMIYGVFGFFSVGTFFVLLTHVILFCSPMAAIIHDQYSTYLGLFILFSLTVFIVHIRPRSIKAINLNTKKINFSRMEYSANDIPIHIDTKKSTKHIFTAVFLAGFIGLSLAGIIGIYLGDDYRLSVLLTAMILISYFFIGYFMLSQAFTAWYVYRKTRHAGQKMTIKEFS